MAGNGDPSEDTPEVTLVDAGEVARTWKMTGTQLDSIGHQVAALKATGVDFPDKINKALFGIGQGCTSVAAQWTTAGGDVQRQHDEVDVLKAAAYKSDTAEVQTAKTAAAQGLMIAALGGSPAYMQSAQASLSAARAKRLGTLDSAVADTNGRIAALPGHATAANDAVQTARTTMVTNSGGQSLPDSVPQIVPPTAASPSGNPSGGPNPKSGNPSGGGKPSGEKPTANKSSVDDKGSGADPSGGRKPQQGQGQQQPNAQQQPQGGQPQQQGGAQPAAGALSGAGTQQRGPGALPVSTPTPARGADPKGSNPSVRPTTPPAPPSTPAQRAGADGRTSPLGSGTTATGAGSGAPTANKSGVVGAGSGAGAGSGTGSGTSGMRGPMGGMMGAGGHGAGQGGTARPKGEVKADPADKKLRGEDVAEQALGGIVKDGDTGAPVPPAPPGSNGGAPVPPARPTKP
ncbi:PPE domain-containing protein [Tsukamurella ocularis]|uniref:hypothetical protein n=1 Tax=Tsukamurella ocularis TaxID=1970234 RepID=UPI0039EF4EB8